MQRSKFLTPGGWLVLALAVSVLAVAPALATDVQSFQFSDAFYLEQGIDPSTLFDKYVFPDAKPGICTDPFDPDDAPPCRTKDGTSPDPDIYNDVQVIEITGGFKHNGNLLYYTTPGKVLARDFLDNDAGDATREICNDFRAFLFPKAAGSPLSPMPPNRRHDNIFQTNNGYFSNNPLGCWRLAFVAWDGPNVNGSVCQGFMDDLVRHRKNESPGTDGLDLDGTPVIRKLGEIEDGEEDGCLTVRVRDENATANPDFPWVI